MDITTGRPNHIMDYLTKLHQNGWWGWRKTDDDGNEIPNSDRMQYQHLIVHPKLWSNELQIMEDNNISQLIVVDKHLYVGIVHIHEILKEGIL